MLKKKNQTHPQGSSSEPVSCIQAEVGTERNNKIWVEDGVEACEAIISIYLFDQKDDSIDY